MNTGLLVATLVTATTGATPLLLAAIGETVAERAGVLNLGLEGMMVLGAVCAFITASATGSNLLGVSAGAMAGAALAYVFALLALHLAANQVASGLAITILGTGLASLLGARFVGHSVAPIANLHVPFFSDIPLLGPLLLRQNLLVYGSLAMTAGVSWWLWYARGGMILRAVGESAASAHALGYDVRAIRTRAVLFGGAMSGLGGAYLSLAATPMWMEGLVAGRGWIALALVVFGAWKPWRVCAGAYLFGGLSVLQLYLQAAGFVVLPTQVLAMIPYLATLCVLVLLSSSRGPACLGKAFLAGS